MSYWTCPHCKHINDTMFSRKCVRCRKKNNVPPEPKPPEPPTVTPQETPPPPPPKDLPDDHRCLAGIHECKSCGMVLILPTEPTPEPEPEPEPLPTVSEEDLQRAIEIIQQARAQEQKPTPKTSEKSKKK